MVAFFIQQLRSNAICLVSLWAQKYSAGLGNVCLSNV